MSETFAYIDVTSLSSSRLDILRINLEIKRHIVSIVVSKDIVSRNIDLFDDDNDADCNGNKDDDDEEEEGFYFIR